LKVLNNEIAEFSRNPKIGVRAVTLSGYVNSTGETLLLDLLCRPDLRSVIRQMSLYKCHSVVPPINPRALSAAFEHHHAMGLHGTGGVNLHRLISRPDDIQRGLPGRIDGQVPVALGNPR
jgi:hypothetical protein